MSSNLNIALETARRGFKVFLLHPEGLKRPYRKGWQASATTDEQVIEEWWTKTPDCGVGILCEDLLVIDVDGPTGHQQLLSFAKDQGETIPKCVRVNSGNAEPHHYHLYFRCPAGYWAKNIKLMGTTKVDIKSGGEQVLAAGNTHPSGKPYKWAATPPATKSAVPEAPEWLLSGCELVPEARHTLRASTAKKRQRKSSAEDSSTQEPGTDSEILHALKQRYPISAFGTRRKICLSATQYLLLIRRLTAPRAAYLLKEHLKLCEEFYESDFSQAVCEAQAMVWSLQKRIRRGDLEKPVNHNLVATQQSLCPKLENYFQSLKEEKQRPPYAYGGRTNNMKISKMEELFIHTLLLRYQYETHYHQDYETFSFVGSQILEMMKLKFGRQVGLTKFKELKDKFIGGKKLRGGMREPVLELFSCQVAAKARGMASVFTPVDVLRLEPADLVSIDAERKSEAEARWRHGPKRTAVHALETPRRRKA